MLKLALTLQAWNTDSFNNVFKEEVCGLEPDALPLQQGLMTGSYTAGTNLSVTVLKIDEDDSNIYVKAGLFYTGIIAGCSCADDPTPLDENPEYCEVMFTINKDNAETTVDLLD